MLQIGMSKLQYSTVIENPEKNNIKGYSIPGPDPYHVQKPDQYKQGQAVHWHDTSDK